LYREWSKEALRKAKTTARPQTEHRNAGAGEGNLYPLIGVREELI
jgi:hypothetical protein